MVSVTTVINALAPMRLQATDQEAFVNIDDVDIVVVVAVVVVVVDKGSVKP